MNEDVDVRVCAKLAPGKRPDDLGIDPGCAQRRNGLVNLRYDDRAPFGGPTGKQTVKRSVPSSDGAHGPSLSNRQGGSQGCSANQSPDLPPRFSSTRTSPITMPRSTALHMS